MHAEMDRVDYCAIKKVYDAYHFDCLLLTNINIYFELLNYILQTPTNSVALRFFLVCIPRFCNFHCSFLDAIYTRPISWMEILNISRNNTNGCTTK